MPASVSSPIVVLAAHAGLDGRGGVEPDADLLVALAAVPDPRKARGCRHRLVSVLAIGLGAVLASARSYVAIAEWAQDLPVSARLRLGLGRRAPSESTIRRMRGGVERSSTAGGRRRWKSHRIGQRASTPPNATPGPFDAA